MIKEVPFDYSKCIPGTFDPYTSSFIYNRFREATLNNEPIVDFIGFVDCDIEDIIFQGE